nr:MAG: carboxypeptidase [Chloroflexota bacterium]
MEAKFRELKARLAEVDDLRAAASVLGWDQQTYMPPGGAEGRSRQMATLSRLAHEKFTDPAVGHLLDDLRPYEESLPYDSDEAALIRVARRDYLKLTRVPASLVAEVIGHQGLSYQTWTEARPANDFARVRPLLEKTLDYSRQFSSFFPDFEHIADPLIDLHDEGMTVATVRPLFDALRPELVSLVEAIAGQPPVDLSPVYGHFPQDRQLAFGLEIIGDYGFDFNRGRQDLTHHPFMTKFSLGDVRITTRVREDDLTDALFSTLHEAGHAMYEQGIHPDLEGTLLADGASSAVHESQSRLWENLVGRSRPFWEHYYPRLQALFPEQLGAVSLDAFYRAVNNVRRSLIRTDADEVTYNLHVMLRFDLEVALLEGKLEVRHLPEAWNDRYRSDLGIVPPDDRDGVLQDVHWFSGLIGGMFQGYTLGNILSAQFFEAATTAHPEILTEIGQGRFSTLHGWLKENLYRHGRKFTTHELVQRVTGGPISVEPYLRYLKTKYGELYGVEV